MTEKQVKPLKYKTLPGLSEKQLSEHHDVLYAGYVKKQNEIKKKVESVDLTTANATYADLRELKLEETFALNGVRLHEGYFDVMGGAGGEPTGDIAQLMAEDFGSVQNWMQEFKALGICSRGWVVLAMDWHDGILRNVLCDAHNQGGVWGCTALLILDVYEHAYFVDYATGRKAYIETFMKNVDWEQVNASVKRTGIMRMREQMQKH